MNKRIVNGLLLFAMMFAGIARVPVIVSGAQNDIAADVLLASGSGIPQTAESNGNSWHPSVSSDGRFIAFTSEATNLVENDTNGKPDIFVHDKDTDTTFMVSVNSSFEYARYTAVSDGSDYPLISADGKYVTFGSDAYNLGGTNGNSCTEIYRHGIFTGITELVTKSVKSDPECDISFAHMGYPTSISANGQYIVFQSKRLDLVPDEQVDNSWDTYVRDMVNNTTTKLSQDPRIGSYNYAGWKGNISGDGNLVSYEELLSNIAYTYDVKLYNRTNGETKSILELMGLVPRGVYLASHAHLSADGRYLSFYYSCYTDTACLGVDYDEGYYIFDIESSTFIRVNFPDILVINTESISADANYLSYYVTDSGWGVNIYISDISDRTNPKDTFVAKTIYGDGESSFSKDMGYVVFKSDAPDLISDDTNSFGDVFLYNTQTQEIERVSVPGVPLSGPFGFDFPLDYVTVDNFLVDINQGGYLTSWFDHSFPAKKDTNLIRWDGTKHLNATLGPLCDREVPMSCYDGHEGLDFRAPEGTVVRAAADGEIIGCRNDYDEGYGNYILIRHRGGFFTKYAHLKKDSLKLDNKPLDCNDISSTNAIPVTSGTQIAQSGSSGTDDPHLHFNAYYKPGSDGSDLDWNFGNDVDPYGWWPIYGMQYPDLLVEGNSLWKTRDLEPKKAGISAVNLYNVTLDSLVYIPDNSLVEDGYFHMLSLPPMQGLYEWKRSLNKSYRIWVTETPEDRMFSTGTSLLKPMTILMRYSDEEVPHFDENELQVYRSDGNNLVPLQSTVDTTNNEVIAETTELGYFDLVGDLKYQNDESEPYDENRSGTEVDLGTGYARAFDIPLDQDWFVLKMSAGATYTLSTFIPGKSSSMSVTSIKQFDGVDTVLELYDQSGATLITSDDNGGDGLASRILWKAVSDGYYYIRIVPKTGSLTGENALYSFRATSDMGTDEPVKVFLSIVVKP